MRKARRTTIGVAAGVSLALLAAPAGASAAEKLYGVTADNELTQFTSQAPEGATEPRPISGLAENDRIVGIDVRPATDQLYALGSSSRLYLLNPVTARARAIAGGPFAPALNGGAFGFDFNPTVDRIRVVSDADQNLRLNPNDQAVITDSPINSPDGQNPTVTGSAYTNSTPGATSTQLFGIDSGRDVLVVQNPPNAGIVNTVGPLNVDAGDQNGFDITSDNVAYATFGGPEGSKLYRVDTTTGRATEALPSDHSAIGTKGKTLVGLAAAGEVPDDSTAPSVLLAADRVQKRSRVLRSGIDAAASCSETCTLVATLTSGTRTIGTTFGSVDGSGFDSIDVRLTSAGKRLVRRGPVRLKLTVAAIDSAFNDTVKSRTITVR
jgi:hypothetical protein